jgi:hypothetical protein
MRYVGPLLILLLIAGCSKKGTDSDISGEQILPLSVGNSWSYTELPAAGFSGDTNNYTLSVIKDTLMALTIESSTDIGHWFRVTGHAGLAPTFYANRSSGYWLTFFYSDGATTQIVTSLMAKYPASVGDSYSRIYPPPLQNGSAEVEVISTGTQVTVPAGTFSCYVYRVYLPATNRLSFDSYYALGVGLVKMSFYGLTPADSSVTRETRLSSYNVK